ncbi:hypothetical protein CIPAW_05G200700 [Carya illinoinensis]|uniref:ATP synthase F0 subunit 8 n=1 Tax=Carya illinoinensis TaxID=32201 RepID=A0A8T1QM99_CARIL|nr:hypothetical protein CIPAW_05G200700 [Carya illinoinensis]
MLDPISVFTSFLLLLVSSQQRISSYRLFLYIFNQNREFSQLCNFQLFQLSV